MKEAFGGPPLPVGTVEATFIHDVMFVMVEFQRYIRHHDEVAMQLDEQYEGIRHTPSADLEYSGRPGRPAYVIRKSDLESLIEVGFNFRQISRHPRSVRTNS